MGGDSEGASRSAAVIVGAGLMGRWHAYYARRCGANVAAVVDLDAGRAEALARKHPGAEALGLERALERADVAHICLPPGAHAEVAGRALESGCDVLVEKPLALSERDAAELYRAAAARGRLLTPVHQFPWQRGFRRLLEQAPELGRKVRARMELVSAAGEGRSSQERRGLMLETLPHPLSALQALREEAPPAEEWRIDRFDADVLLVRAEAQRFSFEAVIDLASRPTANRLVLFGEHGTAHVDFFHGYCWFERGEPSRRDKALRPFRRGWSSAAGAAGNLMGRAWRREPAYPGLRELMAAFYRARGGGPNPVRPEDAIEISRLVERFES